jgi:ceramide glucosyltransferase
VALLRRLMAKHAHVPARLLVGNDAISGNPKLNNFAKGWTAASHEWIVVSDSNALLPRDCIQRLLARWDFRTGLVCSPPVGAHPIGIWAELECAFLNTYQARWQCFADAIGFGFAQGKTMLWRRDFLDEAGGVRALAAELAEDAAATKLVRHAGLHVRLVNAPFAQPLGERTASEVWNRQLRWSRLRRDAFKAYFALEILSGGAPALLAGGVVAAAAGWPLPAALIALATLWYGAEAVLAYAAGWYLTRRSPLLWLARDSMLPVLWTISWLGNAFVWRGHEMRVADRTSPA